jgi:gluconolactonase
LQSPAISRLNYQLKWEPARIERDLREPPMSWPRNEKHSSRTKSRRGERRHVSDIFEARYAARKKWLPINFDREHLSMSRPQDVAVTAAAGLTRRELVKTFGAGAGILALGAAAAGAQTPAGPVAPPSTVTSPPRDFGPNGAPNTYFWDPDVIAVDPSFNGLAQPNAPIQRLWTGALWSEGPAWNAQGRYLVWSDIPNNRQLRWLEDDGRVTVMRAPSNNSNGNTFDFQGRQLSCEHLTRRVVRYELDGSVTVLAERFDGKRLNSPNDVVPHPDGSYWFTDPPYGGQLYEGAPDAAGGPSNPQGRLKNRLGQAAEIGEAKRELPTNCYRIDPSGRIDLVVTEDQVPDPNGLCFSHDYKKLYVVSTGKGPGDTGPGGKGEMYVFDVGSDNKLSNRKLFSDFMIDGVKCGPDGVRADVNGNLWCSSNAGRSVGYSGVTVWNPDGKLLGRIRIPEICGNVCFGGPKRNRLFMAASQSLYAVYTATQGAAPG